MGGGRKIKITWVMGYYWVCGIKMETDKARVSWDEILKVMTVRLKNLAFIFCRK